MTTPKPTAKDATHQAALRCIEAFMGAEKGTPEGEILDMLVDFVERYEK